jgi:hypothetical protein
LEICRYAVAEGFFLLKVADCWKKILIPDLRICSCGATFLEKVDATVAIVLPSNCGVSIASKKKKKKIAHAHL